MSKTKKNIVTKALGFDTKESSDFYLYLLRSWNPYLMEQNEIRRSQITVIIWNGYKTIRPD